MRVSQNIVIPRKRGILLLQLKPRDPAFQRGDGKSDVWLFNLYVCKLRKFILL